jgi:hypothetical protein
VNKVRVEPKREVQLRSCCAFEQLAWHANEKSEGDPMRQRGVFEKEPGSGVLWIRYFDQFGKKRREKAGTKSVAIKLYGKRKQQVLEGKKLPELFRKRP